MFEIGNAPEKGMMLAYFRKSVVFEEYTKESVTSAISEYEGKYGELLEIHLFDAEKEFRAVRKENATYIKCEIPGANEEGKEFLEEEMYVDTSYAKAMETIRVVNYLDYSKDNGMLQIYNYRLAI